MRISRVGIHNFKCFSDVEIDLKDLNVLTGANSSGKSSVIQAILYKIQSMCGGAQDRLNGEFVRLGTVGDIRNCYTRGNVEINLTFSQGDDINLEHVTYLVTDRISSREDFRKNEDGIFSIGIHGEYAFDYLSRNRMESIGNPAFIFDDRTGANLGNQVNYWLNYLCGYSVTAEQVEGTSIVRVSFKTDDNVKSFRSVDVGTGVTFLAVIVITALSCVSDDLLIIENPELYLHPAAQSRLMELFSFLASRGLQIIIETHSDHIVSGVRKNIKRGVILPEDVAILYIQREDNKSVISEIHVNENGSLDNPMKGFFDQIDNDLDYLLGFDNE